MNQKLKSLPLNSFLLSPSIFSDRTNLNYKYVMSLKNENLLQNHYMEAGLWSTNGKPENCHWGWESPSCQVKGHFLGHWLSASSKIYAITNDQEVKAKADRIVSELGKCQKENGGEWVGSIPEKYLEWIAKGRWVWAPQYVLHKTLMGLFDSYSYTGNNQALEIIINWAKWFHRWTGNFTREQMDDILDYETGGMLEVWANLYGVTHQKEHYELLQRYDRRLLFDRILDGEDVLTNMHANTTIPEICGAARAWEVTGETRYRKIVEAYWDMAVSNRGVFCTGGQSNGEVWTPPNEFSARLGDKNQEHCSVYNMIHLAEYLLRWTGDVKFADYIERNIYNGLLAQQNPKTGMVSYFLPLQAGSFKKWGTQTDDFWCCHGTLVQANSAYGSNAYFEDENGLVICQYIPSTLTWKYKEKEVKVIQAFDQYDFVKMRNINPGETRRPNSMVINFDILCDQPTKFAIRLRVPWWVMGDTKITINGITEIVKCDSSSFYCLNREWGNDKVRVEFPKSLTSCALPDRPDTVAFMDGPVVLAGICDEQRILYGNEKIPETIMIPDNEREWHQWRPGYLTVNQQNGFKFIPLYEVCDEKYTIYFQVQQDV